MIWKTLYGNEPLWHHGVQGAKEKKKYRGIAVYQVLLMAKELLRNNAESSCGFNIFKTKNHNFRNKNENVNVAPKYKLIEW